MKKVERPLRYHFLKWFSLLPLLAMYFNSAGQQTTNIWVLDRDAQALPFVEINGQDEDIFSTTDAHGFALITYHHFTDSIFVHYVGYEPRALTIRELLANEGVLVLDEITMLVQQGPILVIGRLGLDQREMPYEIRNISSRQIDELAAQSSAEVLEQSGEIFVQKSQMGGGSPIMRGFEANKLLMVIDGVRLNNAIYRSGHLQNAITIDASGLSRIELIYGPNSLIYGSDAFGGVIHFKTKDPKLSIDNQLNYNIRAFSRYASSNNGKTFHIDGEVSRKKWGILMSASRNDFGNLSSGENRNSKYPDYGKRNFYVKRIAGVDSILMNPDPKVQLGTAYKQWDMNAKWIYQPTPQLRLSSNIQFSNSSNIPRYDQLNYWPDGVPRFAEWYYGPQQRSLLSFTLDWTKANRFFDEAKWIIAHQIIGEDRIMRKFGSVRRTSNRERVNVSSLTLDLKKKFNAHHRFLQYGIESNFNDVRSSATVQNIDSGETSTDILTRYPDDLAQMTQWAFYAVMHYEWSKQTNFEIGARTNLTRLDVRYKRGAPVTWPDNYYEGIDQSNPSFTWSTGLNYESRQNWHWRFLAATAFRSPNIDDFAKIRIKNDQITIPNVNLTPERSFNAEIGLQKTFDMPGNLGVLNVSFTAYYSRLFDLIARDTFQPGNGATHWEVEGDLYRLVANRNLDNGRIMGISSGLEWQFVPELKATFRMNMLRGVSWKSGQSVQPLAHIPPSYGSAQLIYDKHSWAASIQNLWNGSKPLSEYALGSSDNEEYATPDGSPAWNIWNVQGTYRLSKHFEVQLRINNLSDLHYRTFSSGVSASGRNIIGTVRYRIH